MELITEYLTFGARKAERKERPKLTHVNFIFDRGSLPSRLESFASNEVFTFSPRLVSQGRIILDDLRSSYPSILFILVGVRSRIIFDDLRPILVQRRFSWWRVIPFLSGEWACACFIICLRNSAPEATLADEKSFTVGNKWYYSFSIFIYFENWEIKTATFYYLINLCDCIEKPRIHPHHKDKEVIDESEYMWIFQYGMDFP